MSELIPCPFCDAKNTDIGFIAHTDGCYLMRRYMNAPKAKLLESWNIRPREAELLARADLAEREVKKTTNFLRHIMTLGLLRGSPRLRDEALRILDGVEALDDVETSSDNNKLDDVSLEYTAKWIENSLTGETNERVIEFGNNMAMSIRAAKPHTQTNPTSKFDDDICPECGGSGEVAGDYFSDDGMSPCARCNGKGGEE